MTVSEKVSIQKQDPSKVENTVKLTTDLRAN